MCGLRFVALHDVMVRLQDKTPWLPTQSKQRSEHRFHTQLGFAASSKQRQSGKAAFTVSPFVKINLLLDRGFQWLHQAIQELLVRI